MVYSTTTFENASGRLLELDLEIHGRLSDAIGSQESYDALGEEQLDALQSRRDEFATVLRDELVVLLVEVPGDADARLQLAALANLSAGLGLMAAAGAMVRELDGDERERVRTELDGVVPTSMGVDEFRYLHSMLTKGPGVIAVGVVDMADDVIDAIIETGRDDLKALAKPVLGAGLGEVASAVGAVVASVIPDAAVSGLRKFLRSAKRFWDDMIKSAVALLHSARFPGSAVLVDLAKDLRDDIRKYVGDSALTHGLEQFYDVETVRTTIDGKIVALGLPATLPSLVPEAEPSVLPTDRRHALHEVGARFNDERRWIRTGSNLGRFLGWIGIAKPAVLFGCVAGMLYEAWIMRDYLDSPRLPKLPDRHSGVIDTLS